MSNQTRYNQILFLMTLSVYMGLLLAGGASPALAQAAMAKGFELKTELEAKDDLDKKPDDKEEIKGLARSLNSYWDDQKSFIEELQLLHNEGKFVPAYDKFSLVESSGLLCGDGVTTNIRHAEQWLQIENQWLEPEVDLLQERLYQQGDHWSDCLTGNKFGKPTQDTDLEISYDGSTLKISFSLRKESPQKAKQLLDRLDLTYKSFEPDEEEPVEALLYESTRISSGNDQVFIVTNLPRAGLDKLLAVK